MRVGVIHRVPQKLVYYGGHPVYNKPMSDEITIDSEIFISSKRASQLSGYEQDYIGQLCRGGNIKARRVGGLWYVSADSLMKYKERANEYKPEPPTASGDMNKADSLVTFDGRGYISTSRTAKITGYSPDYVGQLARAGTIPSRQVGNRWYVEQAEILKHKESKDALLAAVQVESVGLNNTSRKSRATNDSSFSAPLYQYTSDDRELLPAITAIDEEAGQKEEPKDEEAYVIPIHIQPERVERTPKVSRNQLVTVEPRHTLLPMLLPVALLTIVIVLSLGFISLKKSSVYTSNSTQEAGKSARPQAIEHNRTLGAPISSQLASAGMSFIGRVGDLLEVLIVPELVYRRSK